MDRDSKRVQSQSEFRCSQCGYEDHADLNAAKNILKKATE